MKKYVQIVEDIEKELEDAGSLLLRPEPITRYYSYLGGEAVLHVDKSGALFRSKIIEKIVLNQKEIDRHYDQQKFINAKASEIFQELLTEDVKSYAIGFTEKEIDFVISRVYSNSNNTEEMSGDAMELIDMLDEYKKIIKDAQT